MPTQSPFPQISTEELIELVQTGHSVKTGIDIALNSKSDHREFQMERRRAPLSPRDAYQMIPSYLRNNISAHA